MKSFIALSLFVAVASADILPPIQQRLTVVPGAPKNELEGRIVNGEYAEPGEIPYMVGLNFEYGNSSAWCGGTLISNRWILTAATCIFNADGVTAYLGAINIRNQTEKGQQRVYSSKGYFHVHPNSKAPFTHNIGLVKLPVAIEFNDRIQPATLPHISEAGSKPNYADKTVVASGWGKTDKSDESISDRLRYIEAPVVEQSRCKKSVPANYFTDETFCFSTKSLKITCEGDAGGPVVLKDGDTNYVIGMSSYDYVSNCVGFWPVVCSSVAPYLNWIKEIAGVVNN